jgi:hypothetical protein
MQGSFQTEAKNTKAPIGSNIPTEALNKPFQLTPAHGKIPD